MRQRIGGVSEPWWRPLLRCPCFWGEVWSWRRLCVMRAFKANARYRPWRDGPWWPEEDDD